MRVLIAGVAGSLGRALAGHLLADPACEQVIGLDAGACYPPVPGLDFVRASLRQPEWTPRLAQVDAAVLLTGLAWPLRRSSGRAEEALVEDSKSFVRAAVAAGVPRLIVASSAALYGDQVAGPVVESAPLQGYQASAYARARAMVSDYLDAVAQGGYNGILTRLRAAWICGPQHLALLHYLTGGPLLACGYGDRVLQVVHEADMVTALVLALRRDLPGEYNVCADGGISFRQLAALVGDSGACAPLTWLVVRAWWRWRWRGQRTPPGWVWGLYHSQPLDAGRLRAAGWTPDYSTRDALVEALTVVRAGG
jgi:UDP-glucose 4-epimerase